MPNQTFQKIVATLTSCVTLGLPTASWAAYVPPSDQVPPKTRGGTAGRRAPCEMERSIVNAGKSAIAKSQAPAGMTALAPMSFLGKTASTRPSFAWFMHGYTSAPIRFSLYEYDPAVKGLKRDILFRKVLTAADIPGLNQPGIKVLPGQELPELKPGSTYAWHVEVICSADSNSKTIPIMMPVRVVEMPEAVRQGLENTTSALQRADLYARSGLWYDALNESIAAGKMATLSLLSDLVNLEQHVEADKEYEPSVSVARALQEVIASEKLEP